MSNREEGILPSYMGKFTAIKMNFYFKIKYKFKAIPIGIPMWFYVELIKITICSM